MNKVFRLSLLLAILIGSAPMNYSQSNFKIQVIPREGARRVDITVDGERFTSYCWPSSLTKPVLYPIMSATGELITRGFPLEPRRSERTDHPHQVGMWFTYGNVNGVDFWNNSTALPAADRAKMGTIEQRKIVRVQSGDGQGLLEVEADWLMPDGQKVLKEDTTFIFRASARVRTIDRITRLTAQDERVSFRDDKEGVFGLRVARWLEQPEPKTQTFTDSNGRTTEIQKLSDGVAAGEYLSSEGIKGDAVWGTRARWVLLHAQSAGHELTLAILDHPSNPGFPTYWHARGYGLFAANPLGQKQLSGGKQELNYSLDAGRSVTFRYRLVIASGPASLSQIEAEYKDFTKTE